MEESEMEKELVEACRAFLLHYKVRAPESCYQMDDVVCAAPELVESVANILGYYDDDMEDLNVSKYGDPRTPEFGVAG
jgi:antitoxin component HigA of HigAB toxin-antitoxin module